MLRIVCQSAISLVHKLLGIRLRLIIFYDHPLAYSSAISHLEFKDFKRIAVDVVSIGFYLSTFVLFVPFIVLVSLCLVCMTSEYRKFS